jgi:hypothetical protein
MNENQQQNNIDNNLFGDRDQIIAYFQEMTRIDDIDQCLALLETSNWNLEDAVQSYLAQNDLMHQEVEEPIVVDKTNSTEDIPNVINQIQLDSNIPRYRPIINHQPTIISSIQEMAFTNFLTDTRRYLEFEIEFKNFKKYFRVADSETIGFLKRLCETEFGIPFEKQVLKGWKDRDPTLINTNVNEIKLRELNLPLKTTLFLLRQKDDIIKESNETSNKSPLKIHPIEQCTYEIFINLKNSIEQVATTSANCDNNNKKNFKLKYDSNQTFSKLKQDLTKLTNLRIKNQDWYWKIPDDQQSTMKDDNKLISESLIQVPKIYDNSLLYDLKQYLYNLYIQQYSNKACNIFKLEFYVKSNQQNSSTSNNNDESISDEEHSESYYEEEDDLNFEPEVKTLKRKTLISDDHTCEYEAVEQFNKEFSERYGSLIPLFFLGSLEDAIKESIMLPANDRKLLAIYLHSDSTIYCNIFCSTIFCNEEIINFLSINYVLWPWDITSQKNEEYFYNLCLKHLGGSMVITTIKQFKNKLPALILLTRVRSNNEIIAVIEGDSTKENLLMSLIQSDEMFQQQRSKDVIEEKQRDDRERIKREQDAAYQASLDYDKAKRQKQEEEIMKELEIKREQEKYKLKLEKEFNDKKILFTNKLKPEPQSTYDNSKELTTIRVKEIDGKMLQRRFNINDPLEQFIYYLGSLGYFAEKYKLLTTWPRRDLTFEPKNKSLKELNLYPQETIILEERDEG